VRWDVGVECETIIVRWVMFRPPNLYSSLFRKWVLNGIIDSFRFGSVRLEVSGLPSALSMVLKLHGISRYSVRCIQTT
jgi:hypothetical protein